jgi:predicted MPP superfamily phosphohydrolase
MKAFYDIRYRFYNESIKHPLTFFLISDIHFAPKVTNETLDQLVKAAKSKHPDYILIPGDLVDYLDTIDAKPDRQRLLSWLERLGQIAPTIISLGNHDAYRINPNRKPHFFGRYPWIAAAPELLFEYVNTIPNVHILDNSSYEDDRVYIFGFTQSSNYFSLDTEDSKRKRNNPEDPGILQHDLSQIPREKLHALPAHKAKIALVHSPFHLLRPEITPFFADFDHIISGHTHNGATPPLIDDFWRSDRGLIAPGNREFLPHLARTGCFGDRHQLIVCGAVTSISDSARKLKFLNTAFPINIATLELTKNESYAHKPNIHRKYINPKSIE